MQNMPYNTVTIYCYERIQSLYANFYQNWLDFQMTLRFYDRRTPQTPGWKTKEQKDKLGLISQS